MEGDRTPKLGDRVAIADDGMVSVEFPQHGAPLPMTVTAPPDQIMVVHRFDAEKVIRDAEARGYARAVAALRDFVRYVRWHAGSGLGDAGYIEKRHRAILADYLEAVARTAEGGELA